MMHTAATSSQSCLLDEKVRASTAGEYAIVRPPALAIRRAVARISERYQIVCFANADAAFVETYLRVQGPDGMNSEQKIILKDACVFFVKLWADSIKDIVLAFAGLGAAAFDILRGRGPDGYVFYRVMRIGQRIDRELDLYGHKDPPDSLTNP